MWRGRQRWQLGPVAVLAAVLLFAGCGGDDEAKSTLGSSEGGAPGIAQGAPPLASDSMGERAAMPNGGGTAAKPAAPSASGPTTDAPGGDAQAFQDLLGRKVVRNGTLDLRVESVGDSYDRVTALANNAGGYVSEATFFGSGDNRSARLVIRVPADRYDRTVAELRALAKEVQSISLQTNDVTAEVTDLDAAVRNLRAVEAQYVQLLSRATAIPDILQVQERLRQVRFEIDRTQSRQATLTRLSDLATVTVQLTPVTAPARATNNVDTPGEAAKRAWEASLDTLRWIGTAAAVVVVYSWWLVPLVVVLVLLLRRFGGQLPRPQARRTES